MSWGLNHVGIGPVEQVIGRDEATEIPNCGLKKTDSISCFGEVNFCYKFELLVYNSVQTHYDCRGQGIDNRCSPSISINEPANK